MIKVKAKRTFFTVFVDGLIKQFAYDSQEIPSDTDLLCQVKNTTGGYDVKLVSRGTVNILLTMEFDTFYEFCHIECPDNEFSFLKKLKTLLKN